MNEEEQDSRIIALEERIKNDAVSFVPGGVNFKLASPQSVDPGHKHTDGAFNSESATDGQILTADGAGGAAFEDNNFIGTFTAGEAITADDAVCLVPAMVVDQDYDESHQTTDCSMGNTAGREFLVQDWAPAAATYIWKVALYLKKVGAPTDNIVVSIYNSSNVLLTTTTIAGSGLTTSYFWYYPTFPDIVLLLAGTYRLAISRSGANNASNYYKWGDDQTVVSPPHQPTYSGGSLKAGATVAGATNFGTDPYSDAIFKTYKEGTTSVLRKTKATDKLRTQNFVGFAVANIADGADGSITRFPSITALSSILPGRPYYISDTAGAISSTVGTYPQQIGVGKTTTSLEVSTVQPILAHNVRWGGINTDVTGSTNPTTMYTTTIPGGTIPANGIMRVTILGKLNNSIDTAVACSFGDKTLDGCTIAADSADFRIICEISNRGVTNAQVFDVIAMIEGAYPVSVHDTATIDTTANQTFSVIVQNPSINVTFNLIYIEIIS